MFTDQTFRLRLQNPSLTNAANRRFNASSNSINVQDAIRDLNQMNWPYRGALFERLTTHSLETSTQKVNLCLLQQFPVSPALLLFLFFYFY